MFKKNSKNYDAQSSQSDMSSQNQERSPNQYQKQSLEHSQDAEYDEEEESQQHQLDDSLEKTNMNRQNKNMVIEDEENQQSSEQEDSDNENGGYFKTINDRNGIHTIREDPGEGIDDDSIDHIEQRIKKLQKDLQTRLNKHKEKPEANNKQQSGKIVSKASGIPPVPKKPSLPNQETQNKMAIMNNGNKHEEHFDRKAEPKKYISSQPAQTQIQPSQFVKHKKQMKQIKKQFNPQIKEEIKIQNKLQQKQVKSKIKERKEVINKQQQKHPMNARIVEMEKIIKDLRLQNQVLKQKLEGQKSKKSRPRNKTVEQLQKIRDSASINEKLQKEIQLLEVIEKLQTKLKKSINKKLASQGNGSISLLHKGLPSSLQSNY